VTNDVDAPPRQPGAAADLAAECRAVTIGESTQQVVALVDDDPSSPSMSRCPQA
jgi:hypothetical protein